MTAPPAGLPQLAATQASLAAIREHDHMEDPSIVDQIVRLRQSVDTLVEVVDGIVAHLQSGAGLVTVKPTIGRVVIYRSKIDNGPGNDVFSPAMVIRTRDTCVPAVIDRWGPDPRTVVSVSDPSVTHQTTARPAGVVAMLPDDDTVDLLVHGLGKDYREYGVRMGDGFGEWAWPERTD